MTGNVVKALAFDVFGTVVDYRGTIMREGERLNQAKGLAVDWEQFADAWRARYRPSMDLVMRGALPWTNLDALHRLSLNELLIEFKLNDSFDADEQTHLNRVWHRLQPWPDAIPGLTHLRKRYVLATLSNGNAENLVQWIWDELTNNGLSEELLYRMRLWETESCFVEITHQERD